MPGAFDLCPAPCTKCGCPHLEICRHAGAGRVVEKGVPLLDCIGAHMENDCCIFFGRNDFPDTLRQPDSRNPKFGIY